MTGDPEAGRGRLLAPSGGAPVQASFAPAAAKPWLQPALWGVAAIFTLAGAGILYAFHALAAAPGLIWAAGAAMAGLGGLSLGAHYRALAADNRYR